MAKQTKTSQVSEYGEDEDGLGNVPVKTLRKCARRLNQTRTLDQEKNLVDLKLLVEIVALAELSIGELMMRVTLHETYDARACPNFDSFAKNDLGMAPSAAIHHMNAYWRYRMWGMPLPELQDIGWIKLGLFAAYLTKENAEEWSKIASRRTVGELSDYIEHELQWLGRMSLRTAEYSKWGDGETLSADLLGVEPTHPQVKSKRHRPLPDHGKDTVKDAAVDIVLEDS